MSAEQLHFPIRNREHLDNVVRSSGDEDSCMVVQTTEIPLVAKGAVTELVHLKYVWLV